MRYVVIYNAQAFRTVLHVIIEIFAQAPLFNSLISYLCVLCVFVVHSSLRVLCVPVIKKYMSLYSSYAYATTSQN